MKPPSVMRTLMRNDQARTVRDKATKWHEKRALDLLLRSLDTSSRFDDMTSPYEDDLHE